MNQPLETLNLPPRASESFAARLLETIRHPSPRARVILLTFYYLAILLALLVMYGRGDFSTPPFIYQGF